MYGVESVDRSQLAPCKVTVVTNQVLLMYVYMHIATCTVLQAYRAKSLFYIPSLKMV